jgi:WD40 repeat protein
VKFPAGYSVCFSDNGELLVCLGRNVVVIDVPSRTRISTSHPLSHPSKAAFSPNGSMLAVKATSGRIVVLDPRSGDVLFDHCNQNDGEGGEARFSPDGEALVDGSWDGAFTLREAGDSPILSREHFPGEMISRLTHDKTRLTWLIEHSPIVQAGEARPRAGFVTLRSWPFTPGAGRNLSFGFDMKNATLSPDGQNFCFIETPAFRLHVARISDGAVFASSEPFDHGGTGNEIAWSGDGVHIASVQAGKFVFYRAADLAPTGEVASQYPSSISFRPGAQEVALGSWSTSAIVPLSDVFHGGTTLK